MTKREADSDITQDIQRPKRPFAHDQIASQQTVDLQIGSSSKDKPECSFVDPNYSWLLIELENDLQNMPKGPFVDPNYSWLLIELENDLYNMPKGPFVDPTYSFSLAELESGEEDRTDEAVHQLTKSTNHMPRSIYDNVATNPISQCFIGFFAADGLNTSSKALTGLGVRSTDFPFIYSLLKACGVREPIMRYIQDAPRPNKTYEAAKLAVVQWAFHDKTFKDIRKELGLPSSRIIDTNVPKARKFLSSLDKVSLLRVFLFWVAGDGSVVFNHVANEILSYANTRLYARDEMILPLLKEYLEARGLRNCATITEYKDNAYMLCIANTKVANDAMLDALNSIPGSWLHPKLHLLKLTLESPQTRIPANQKLSKVSFYDFLQYNLTDNLLGVLGQDFHPLPLQSINAILNFAGFKQVQSIDEFDLVKFKKQTEELARSNGKKNERQLLFLQYYESCRRRVLSEYKPLNYKPKTYDPIYKCTYQGCTQSFPREDHLERHMKTHDPNAEQFPCTFTGCNMKFARPDILKRHMKTHEENKQKIPCTFTGCGQTFARSDGLKRHMKTHDSNAEQFPCTFTGCNKTFSRKDVLKQHMATHEDNREKHPCTFTGCNKTYLRKKDLQQHMKTHKTVKKE